MRDNEFQKAEGWCQLSNSQPKKLFMQTTKVSPERTASEISALLIQAGASQIATEYANQKITGLRWVMIAYGAPRPFEMPARVEPVFQLLKRQRSRPLYANDVQNLREQAERVAWRQLLRWVQSQLAMIECGMVDAEQVFLPYVQTPSGVSLHEAFKTRGFLALPAPEATS